jgi:branched-subunit amino acid transport protein
MALLFGLTRQLILICERFYTFPSCVDQISAFQPARLLAALFPQAKHSLRPSEACDDTIQSRHHQVEYDRALRRADAFIRF